MEAVEAAEAHWGLRAAVARLLAAAEGAAAEGALQLLEAQRVQQQQEALLQLGRPACIRSKANEKEMECGDGERVCLRLDFRKRQRGTKGTSIAKF